MGWNTHHLANVCPQWVTLPLCLPPRPLLSPSTPKLMYSSERSSPLLSPATTWMPFAHTSVLLALVTSPASPFRLQLSTGLHRIMECQGWKRIQRSSSLIFYRYFTTKVLEGWVDYVAFSQLLFKRTVGPHEAYSPAFTVRCLVNPVWTQRTHLDFPQKDGDPERRVLSLQSQLTIKLISLSRHMSKQPPYPIPFPGYEAGLFFLVSCAQTRSSYLFPIHFSSVPFYILVSSREIGRFFCGLFQKLLIFSPIVCLFRAWQSVRSCLPISQTVSHKYIQCAALSPTNTMMSMVNRSPVLKELILWWQECTANTWKI